MTRAFLLLDEQKISGSVGSLFQGNVYKFAKSERRAKDMDVMQQNIFFKKKC